MCAYQTVRVRPIRFDEIAALAHRDAEPVEVYKAKVTRTNGLTLTPATLTPTPVGSKERAGEQIPHHVMFRAVVDDEPSLQSYAMDRSQPVGHMVDCTAVTKFEAKSRFTLFTSEEAERTAGLVRRVEQPERARRAIFVADPEGQEMRLTPVHGSQLTVGVVVAGVDPEQVEARAEAALRAEFGDALGSVRKVKSRPAEDLRVDVYTSSEKEELLAENVLVAEAGYLTTGKPYTEEAAASSAPASS